MPFTIEDIKDEEETGEQPPVADPEALGKIGVAAFAPKGYNFWEKMSDVRTRYTLPQSTAVAEPTSFGEEGVPVPPANTPANWLRQTNLPSISNLYRFFTGDEFSPVTDISRGLSEVFRWGQERVGQLPHALSPFENIEEMTLEQSQPYRKFYEQGQLGRALSQFNYTVQKGLMAIPSFIAELQRMIIKPKDYWKTRPGGAGEPEEVFVGSPPSRFDLAKETVKGLVDMVRDLPTQVNYLAWTGIGQEPTKEEILGWNRSGVIGALLFPDPKRAINAMFEDPSQPGWAMLMTKGGISALYKKGRFAYDMASLKRPAVAEEIKETGLYFRYRQQEKLKQVIKTNIAEGWKKLKAYGENAGESGLGLFKGVNETLLTLRAKTLLDLVDPVGNIKVAAAEKPPLKEAVEGKEPIKPEIIKAEFPAQIRDVESAKTLLELEGWERRRNTILNRILAQVQAKGYHTEKDLSITNPFHWMTPASVIPEIYRPVRHIWELMEKEIDATTNAAWELYKPAGQKKGGIKATMFLRTHTTDEINQFLTGKAKSVEILRPGADSEIYVQLATENLQFKGLPLLADVRWNPRQWYKLERHPDGMFKFNKDGSPVRTPITEVSKINRLNKIYWRGNRWLDDPQLQLAGFARAITDLLAERSGQPAEKYIGRYDTWMRKELMSDWSNPTAPMSLRNIPYFILPKLSAKVWVRFFEHREGTQAPFIDVMEWLQVYDRAVLRKVYIEPLFEELQPRLEELRRTQPNRYKYAVKWLREVRGSPRTKMDIASRKITAAYYQSMLGMAIDSAIKNITQGILTWARTETESYINGIRDYFSGGMDKAREAGITTEFKRIIETDQRMRTILQKVGDFNLAPMQMAEAWNRGTAYLAALRHFQKLGKKRNASIDFATAAAERAGKDFARIITNETQYEYGVLGTSPYLQNPAGRLLGQFMSFPMKYTEVMLNWTDHNKQALARYIVLVGLATMGAEKAGIDIDELFGLKVFPDWRQFKRGVSPSGQAIISLFEAGSAMMEGRPYEAVEKVGTEAKKLLPAGRIIEKGYRITRNLKEGGVYSKDANLILPTTPKEQFLYLFGLRSSESSKQFEALEKINFDQAINSDAYRHWSVKVKRAILENKISEAMEYIFNAADDGVPFQTWETLFNTIPQKQNIDALRRKILLEVPKRDMYKYIKYLGQ